MTRLTTRGRASLPDKAFAYVDSTGRRKLPIHDEAHVRNALARFGRVHFESDEVRDGARQRLLAAAMKLGISPVGFITGQIRSERRARPGDVLALPTGNVTFLLTDVEGSTSLLRRLGDRYTAVLRDLRRLARAAVQRNGGHTVDARGDDHFAVFQGEAHALQAAVEMQRAIAEHAWPGKVQVRVRAGVHSGRPTLTDEGYVGLSVHTVARICSSAHGGQILVSGRARSALDRLPAGVRLRKLGAHKLQGLPKRETLYEVSARGLRSGFPPPRTS